MREKELQDCVWWMHTYACENVCVQEVHVYGTPVLLHTCRSQRTAFWSLFFSFSLYMVSGERTQVASLVQCVIALRGEVSPVWALQEKVSQPFRSL